MTYLGVIIEESLEDKEVLELVSVMKTVVEKVTKVHCTPWLKKWTLHHVAVNNDKVAEVARLISKSLDTKHKTSWYADFKSESIHYIIFRGKVFKVNRNKHSEYGEVIKYGIKLGIPEYQLDFSPEMK